MNKILLILMLLGSLCGCVANKNTLFRPLTIVSRINEKEVPVLVCFDDNKNVLRCESLDDNVSVETFKVYLYVKGSGELVLADNGDLELNDSDVEAALVDFESGLLYVSRDLLMAMPHYISCHYDGLNGEGSSTHKRVFDPSIQLPSNVYHYDCIGCDIGLKVEGEEKSVSVYYFKPNIDSKEISLLRRLL